MTKPRFLLDTNVCVYLAENLSGPLLARLEQCEIGELATSSIAFAEFARGIDWSQPKAADTVQRLFQAIPILPFDQHAAMTYAELPFIRHRFDRLIGAHAKALGVVLVTANVSDFNDIEGLELQDWTR